MSIELIQKSNDVILILDFSFQLLLKELTVFTSTHFYFRMLTYRQAQPGGGGGQRANLLNVMAKTIFSCRVLCCVERV